MNEDVTIEVHIRCGKYKVVSSHVISKTKLLSLQDGVHDAVDQAGVVALELDRAVKEVGSKATNEALPIIMP